MPLPSLVQRRVTRPFKHLPMSCPSSLTAKPTPSPCSSALLPLLATRVGVCSAREYRKTPLGSAHLCPRGLTSWESFVPRHPIYGRIYAIAHASRKSGSLAALSSIGTNFLSYFGLQLLTAYRNATCVPSLPSLYRSADWARAAAGLLVSASEHRIL